MTTIAVLGAPGTVGSRVTARLNCRGVAVVEIPGSHGADPDGGRRLPEALEGVDTVIDLSNPMPHANGSESDPAETITAATRNLVGACASQGIERLVMSTVAGIENPEFDGIPYFEATRAAEDIVLEGPVPPTIVKSTQWHESALDAVLRRDGEVVAPDWLIQAVAADTVADVLVEAALSQTRAPRTITGPDVIRLPKLAAKVLAARGDIRPVRAVKPALTPLAAGGLLAPDHAVVLGPDIETWLETWLDTRLNAQRADSLSAHGTRDG